MTISMTGGSHLLDLAICRSAVWPGEHVLGVRDRRGTDPGHLCSSALPSAPGNTAKSYRGIDGS